MVFVLPYDGSAEAQLSLAHLAGRMRQHGRTDQLLLALVVTRRGELERLVAEARTLAGPDVPFSVRLIPEDDLYGALARLQRVAPATMFVAPVGVQGPVSWYYVVVRTILAGWFGQALALHLRPAPRRARSAPPAPTASPRAPRWATCTLRDAGRRPAHRDRPRVDRHPTRFNSAGEG